MCKSIVWEQHIRYVTNLNMKLTIDIEYLYMHCNKHLHINYITFDIRMYILASSPNILALRAGFDRNGRDNRGSK